MFPLSHFLCPLCPAWDPTVHRLVSILPEFWGGPFFQNYIVINDLSPPKSCFLTWYINCSKKHIPVYKWRESIVPFGDIVLYSFSGYPPNVMGNSNFPVQKTLQNYAFWVTSKTICTPRSSCQMGVQNAAKCCRNARQITAKRAWKIHNPIVQLRKMHAVDRPPNLH